MTSITLYKWRARDPACPWKKGKWDTLRWKMTEEDAEKWCTIVAGREIEKVEGTREVITGAYDPLASGRIQAGVKNER